MRCAVQRRGASAAAITHALPPCPHPWLCCRLPPAAAPGCSVRWTPAATAGPVAGHDQPAARSHPCPFTPAARLPDHERHARPAAPHHSGAPTELGVGCERSSKRPCGPPGAPCWLDQRGSLSGPIKPWHCKFFSLESWGRKRAFVALAPVGTHAWPDFPNRGVLLHVLRSQLARMACLATCRGCKLLSRLLPQVVPSLSRHAPEVTGMMLKLRPASSAGGGSGAAAAARLGTVRCASSSSASDAAAGQTAGDKKRVVFCGTPEVSGWMHGVCCLTERAAMHTFVQPVILRPANCPS